MLSRVKLSAAGGNKLNLAKTREKYESASRKRRTFVVVVFGDGERNFVEINDVE